MSATSLIGQHARLMPAALINAITDALGVKDIEMPATPQRVWRVCQRMKKAA